MEKSCVLWNGLLYTNNKFVIDGNENRVEIRDNVEINGSDQQNNFYARK